MLCAGDLGQAAFADGVMGAPALSGAGLQAVVCRLCAASDIKNTCFSLIVLDLLGKK